MKKFMLQYVDGFEYIEGYLQDMAEKGFVLTKPGIYFMEFEECVPSKRRYRILSSALKEKHPAPKGWHYIGHAGSIHYYETEDQSLPEIIEDVDEYGKMISPPLWAALLLFLIGILKLMDVKDLIHPSYTGTLHMLHNEGVAYHVTGAVFGFVCIFACIAFFAYWISMRNRIRKNLVTHEKRHKSRRWILNTLTILVIICAIVNLCNGMEEYDMDCLTYDEIIACSDTHPFKMEEMDPEKEKEARIAVKKNGASSMGPCEYVIYEGSDRFFPKFSIRSVALSYEGEEEKDMFFDARYYEGKDQKTIDQYLEEDIFWGPGEKLSKEQVKVDGYDGADFAGYYEDDYGIEYIWVQKGTRMETVSYDGEKKLFGYMDAVIKDLNEK